MADKKRIRLIAGDCLEHLQQMAPASVDAICIDPPAGIAFMGKAWDSDRGGRDAWIDWLSGIMAELLRVTKPGGHMLCWALPRTQHWTATAVEDAGWQVRDVLMHVFGSGFPKSMDVSKAIDSAAGAEREVIGSRELFGTARKGQNGESHGAARTNGADYVERVATVYNETAPATAEAKQWAGWGTALKPSHEAWILARKPLAGTVAATVLEHGTGALNIDGCRVGTDGGTRKGTHPNGPSVTAYGHGLNGACEIQQINAGRWPPHLLISHGPDCGETCADGCPVAEMDAQSGVRVSPPTRPRNQRARTAHAKGAEAARTGDMVGHGDTGGASRFFPVFRYVAKPSTAEKSAGLDGRNEHATVKSIELMRWLVRLITPPGGLVLDCFMGSGTTGIAAVLEGARFVGIEQRPAMVEVARRRIAHWETGADIDAPAAPDTGSVPAGPHQMGLFG